jgi:hypothetical protein
MKIEVLPEYSHDLKRLLKKFPSLTEDVARACKVIEAAKNRDRGLPLRHQGTKTGPDRNSLRTLGGLRGPIPVSGIPVHRRGCQPQAVSPKLLALDHLTTRALDHSCLTDHSPGKTDLDLARLKRHFC